MPIIGYEFTRTELPAPLGLERPPNWSSILADVATSEYRLSKETTLKNFVANVLTHVGVAPADAAVVADVLVLADLRGIE